MLSAIETALRAGVRLEREAADVKLLEGLTARGPHTLRCRDTPIDLWAETDPGDA